MSKQGELEKALTALTSGEFSPPKPTRDRSKLTAELEEALGKKAATDEESLDTSGDEFEPEDTSDTLGMVMAADDDDELDDEPVAYTLHGMAPANATPVPPRQAHKNEDR